MKLHANAPFGPKGRLMMVRRVTEQGWSLTEAAEVKGEAIWDGFNRDGEHVDPAAE